MSANLKYQLLFGVLKKALLSTLFICALLSCTGLRPIQEKNPLLTDQTIVWPDKFEKSKELKSEVKKVLKPEPNTKLLWMRPTLVSYNLIKETKKEKGVKYMLKNKIGAPPVLLNEIDINYTSKLIKNRMQVNGYFHATVDYSVRQKKKTALVEYTIDPGTRYHLNSITYPSGDQILAKKIAQAQSGSLLKTGSPYKLGQLIDEKERISSALKDSGFYYFHGDYLLFKADTFNNQHLVDLQLQIMPEIAKEATHPYRMNQIMIVDDYDILNYTPDTFNIYDYTYISENGRYKPEVILKRVLLKKGDLYSYNLQNRSIKHLMNLGTHKYVNFQFTPDTIPNQLNATLLMSPLKQKSISYELNTIGRSTNYAGPLAKLTYRNRNIFGGAEQLNLSANGSFEIQLGGDSLNTSYNIGLDAELRLPNLYPFSFISFNRENSSSTLIKTGIEIFRRLELYSLESIYTSYGLYWQGKKLNHHRINIIDISFNRTTNVTNTFLDYLDENPSIQRSFENQFIVENSYMYTLNHLGDDTKRIRHYFNGSFDVAGQLINSLLPDNGENEGEFFGVPVAEYIRSTLEYRNYFRIAKQNIIASKFKIGVGLPTGNSSVLPYIKQYYAGGTNSIRAFMSRSVGPGSYQLDDDNTFIDQTGDILIESSIEYRFDLIKMLKGAIFIDAGNIWSANEDSSRPGSNFNINTFYNELAIGSGFGFRFDADIIVVRLDIAKPIYNPSLASGERWQGEIFRPWQRNWWQSNIFNFAIGYPF